MCRARGDDAQEANFLWREAIRLRKIAKEESLRQLANRRKIAAQAAARMAAKSYGMAGPGKRMKLNASIVEKCLAKGISREAEKFNQYAGDINQ